MQWSRTYTKFDNVLLSVHMDDGTVRYWATGQGAVKVIGHLKSWGSDLRNFKCSLPEGGLRGVASMQTMDLGPL